LYANKHEKIFSLKEVKTANNTRKGQLEAVEYEVGMKVSLKRLAVLSEVPHQASGGP